MSQCRQVGILRGTECHRRTDASKPCFVMFLILPKTVHCFVVEWKPCKYVNVWYDLYPIFVSLKQLHARNHRPLLETANLITFLLRSLRPPDDRRSNFTSVLFANRPRVSDTVLRNPVKSISVVGSYALHEKSTQIKPLIMGTIISKLPLIFIVDLSLIHIWRCRRRG